MSRCHANRPSAEQIDGIGKVISSTAFHTFQPCSVRYAYVLRRIYVYIVYEPNTRLPLRPTSRQSVGVAERALTERRAGSRSS